MKRIRRLICPVVIALIVTGSPGPAWSAQAQGGPSPAQTALKEGRALLKRGKADQALIQLNKALALYTQAGDETGTAAAHDALGDLYAVQGQYRVALDHYEKAHAGFSAKNDAYNANLMLAKIGDMYYRQGQITEARAAYSRITAQKPEMNVARTVDTARDTARKPSRWFRQLKDIATTRPSTSTPSTVVNTGAGIAGDINQQLNTYRQYIIYSIYQLGLGRVDFFNKQYDAAKKHFEDALAAADHPIYGNFGQARRFRVAARTSLGDIALGQGRHSEAIKLYTDALNGARKDNRLDLLWPAQRGLGKSRLELAASEKDPKKAAKLREEAIGSYREALQTIETIRAGSLRADESRTTFLATTRDVFDEATGALAEMALVGSPPEGGLLEGPARELAAEAFKVMESGRARSLLDLLSENGAEITEGVPADLVKRKADNLSRQQEIAEVLTGVNLAGEANTKSVGDLEAELDRLAVEYDQIENQIRSASPRYAALTAARPLALAEVQQQVLDDRTALLEYSLGAEGSYLWAITRDRVALFRLPPRAVLEKQAIEFRDRIVPAQLRRQIITMTAGAEAQRGLGLASAADAQAGAFAAAANTLYKMVVGPAAQIIGDKRLLIVADGALNYIPFEALVTAAGGSDYATLPYLIKTNEVVYAPSASVIAAVRQPARTPGRGVLLIADPVFDAKDPRARARPAAADEGDQARGLGLASALTDVAGAEPASAAPAGGLPLARLAGTRAEAQQIAQLARASGIQPETWLDLEASESNIETRDIRPYRILHIATHGLLDAERPQFTGLVLSLVGEKGRDGFLRADEVFNLKLGSPLVMLSACETGLGKEKRGEGIMGLTRAFMYAGAPTVGVSLWSVADRSTADLMTDFYKELLAKPDTSPSTALRTAQQKMIASKNYNAPFYWAPFVLVGDWR
jgi:CHAT domain-containing protein/predicted negative regulator of RcsB-dependent stress response